MKEICRVDKKSGTLRDLCVTLKTKVPQDKSNGLCRLQRLRDLAGPQLYYAYARAHAHMRTCVGGREKVPLGPADWNNLLHDNGLGCGTYPIQGPAKVPQIDHIGPAAVEVAS